MPMNAYWRKKFAWSNSRFNQWKECKKQFYFNRIKKYDGLPDDPGREKLWHLSNAQKLAFLKGSLVHDTIKQQISNYIAGRGIDANTAKEFFLAQFDNTMSKMNLVITEAMNGFPPGEAEINGIREDGLRQIENFCNITWNNYKNVNYLSHEQFGEFHIDNIRVIIRYDFLAEKNGIHVITDWKTGSSGFDDINESTQMGAYVLWLNKTKSIPIENIRGEVVYLKTNETEVVKKSKQSLQKTADFIKQGAEEILSVKSEKDMPASPSKKKCVGCNFLTVCEEGKEVVKSY